MLGKHEPQVLIVGAGPVGLYAALALVERGIRVQIVDEQWRTSAHSYACALHPHSLKLLAEAGLAGDLLDAGHRVRTVAFYDGAARRAEMRLSELPVDFSFLLVLRQDALEGLLEQRLEQKGVRVQWNHRVAQLQPHDGRIETRIDKLEKISGGYAVPTSEWMIEKTRRARADFVIGADGRRSFVRRALEAEYEPHGAAASFAVFEFLTEAPVGDEVCVVLNERTTNVLWPLARDRVRWSLQLTDAALPDSSREKCRLAVQVGGQSFPYLDAKELRGLLHERAPWFRGDIGHINWSMAVRFEQRLATRFGRGRIWLAGDAAHTAGPVGVQSMNVGFREAHDLACRMAAILRDDAPLESLETYNDERLAEWRQLLAIDGGLTPDQRADDWIAQRSARLLPCIPASGPELAHLAGQVGLAAAPCPSRTATT